MKTKKEIEDLIKKEEKMLRIHKELLIRYKKENAAGLQEISEFRIRETELKLIGLYEQRARLPENKIKLRSEEEIIERYDTVYCKIKELEKEVQDYAEKNMLGAILMPRAEVRNKIFDYNKKQKELENELDFCNYMIAYHKYIPWLLGLEG